MVISPAFLREGNRIGPEESKCAKNIKKDRAYLLACFADKNILSSPLA